MRDYVADDFLDHHPLPGQPAGVEGAEYVVATMHGAHPDLRFSIEDLVAEDDRVTIRWTMRGTRSGPMLGQPPTNAPWRRRRSSSSASPTARSPSAGRPGRSRRRPPERIARLGSGPKRAIQRLLNWGLAPIGQPPCR